MPMSLVCKRAWVLGRETFWGALDFGRSRESGTTSVQMYDKLLTTADRESSIFSLNEKQILEERFER